MNFIKVVYIYILFILFVNSKGAIFDETGDFVKAANFSSFVDKTMLIKTIFETGRRMLITAPRKFGKSMNLDMLKRFLSIESENNSVVISTFRKTKIYEKDRRFFRLNFAKHPVLFVNFKCGITNTYQDAVRCYKEAINKAYIEHKYLISSHKLLDDDKKTCKLWSGSTSFIQMQEEHINSGLYSLARMLQEHFDKNIVVLVDEYDSVINNALFEVNSSSDFRAVIALTSHILSTLLKQNKNVNLAVVTGVSYISTTGLSDINNLESYRFLDNHQFVNFYGFLLSDVEVLFRKKCFNLVETEIEKAYNLYNGYVCRSNRTVLNPYSVLNFLESRVAKPYWIATGYVINLLNYFRFPNIDRCVDKLLSGKTLEATIYEHIGIDQVIKLKDIIQQKKGNFKADENLFLSHLMEVGYLSYVKTSSKKKGTTKVKLPNEEVKQAVLDRYKEYYIEVCKLDGNLVKNMGYGEFKSILQKCDAFTNKLLKHGKQITDWLKIFKTLKDWW